MNTFQHSLLSVQSHWIVVWFISCPGWLNEELIWLMLIHTLRRLLKTFLVFHIKMRKRIEFWSDIWVPSHMCNIKWGNWWLLFKYIVWKVFMGVNRVLVQCRWNVATVYIYSKKKLSPKIISDKDVLRLSKEHKWICWKSLHFSNKNCIYDTVVTRDVTKITV